MDDRMRRVDNRRYHVYTPMLGTSTLIPCAPCNENEFLSIMELRTRIQSCAIDLRNRIIGNYNQSLNLLEKVRNHDIRYKNWDLLDIVNGLRNPTTSAEVYDVLSDYHPYYQERDMNMEFFFISNVMLDYIGINIHEFPQLRIDNTGADVIAMSRHAYDGFYHTHENIISCLLLLNRMIMDGRTYDRSLRDVVTRLL